jgi:hypothetical protein
MKTYSLFVGALFLCLALTALIVPKANADPPFTRTAQAAHVKFIAPLADKIDASAAVFVSDESASGSGIVMNSQGLSVLKPQEKGSGHDLASANQRRARLVFM